MISIILNSYYLLMWDMCMDKMKIFTKDVSADGSEATKVKF